MSQRIDDIIAVYPKKNISWTDAAYEPIKVIDTKGIAEFIVKECIGIALRHSHRDDDMGAIIAEKIRKELL